MCTLSWEREGDTYNVVFSRDERIDRAAALTPRSWSWKGRASCIAPIDPEGGGTWIAVNGQGITLCLLNDYETLHAPQPGEVLQSRGVLVRELAPESSSAGVAARLKQYDLTRFNAFVLVVFCRGQEPQALHWDGQALSSRLALRCPLTSSSLNPKVVRRHRERVYDRARARAERRGSKLNLLDFHRTRSRYFPHNSVAMKRDDRETLSLTRVAVGRQQVRMSYYAGDPTEKLVPVVTSLPLEPVHESARGVPPKVSAPKRCFELSRLFEEKNPALYARAPKSAFAALGALLREQQVNQVLHDLGEMAPTEFPERALRALGAEVRYPVLPEQSTTTLSAPQPATPAPIYVANHPLGGIDGMAMLAWILREHGSVIAPVNDVLLKIPHLRAFCVPIDKSRAGRGIIKTLDRVFDSRKPVLLFPAGRTSRMHNGQLRDSAWGRMVATRALRHQRPVVPVFVSGRNSRSFYRVAALRQALGIKLNMEMFLLPREVLKPASPIINLKVGKAILPDELQMLGRTALERAAALRCKCYELQETASQNACSTAENDGGAS